MPGVMKERYERKSLLSLSVHAVVVDAVDQSPSSMFYGATWRNHGASNVDDIRIAAEPLLATRTSKEGLTARPILYLFSDSLFHPVGR